MHEGWSHWDGVAVCVRLIIRGGRGEGGKEDGRKSRGRAPNTNLRNLTANLRNLTTNLRNLTAYM